MLVAGEAMVALQVMDEEKQEQTKEIINWDLITPIAHNLHNFTFFNCQCLTPQGSEQSNKYNRLVGDR